VNLQTLKGAVEAVLFAVGEPVAADKIAEAVSGEKREVLLILRDLKEEYDRDGRGFCLLQFDDRYQLATMPAYGEAVQKALDTRRNAPLSQAALEVLAIVAYNQPVSRSFIDQIRGVDSSSPVQSLLTKNLICEAGRLDLPGRPISFKTTDNFLRCFGLPSVDSLPPVHSAESQAETGDPDESVLVSREMSAD